MTKKASRPPASPPRKPNRPRDRGRRSSHRMVNILYLFMAAVLVVGAGIGFSEILLGKDSTTTNPADTQPQNVSGASPTATTSANAAQLPKFVKASPSATREAYLYAMEHRDVLSYVPCYCGCGQHSGHQSNWNCFIKSQTADGTFVFDDHGAG